MKRSNKQTWALAISVLFCVTLTAQSASSQEAIRYSCSAQVNESLGSDIIKAFTQETGVAVETYVSSSNSAVYRLFSDFSDIASTTERIYHRYKEYGYVQMPFCRDPLAIVVNNACPVRNISEEQLKGIFSRSITNWQELGGPDEAIVVMVPGMRTGAFSNFERQILSRREMQYDFLAYRSTRVMDAVEKFPAMITFIGYGTTKGRKSIKVLSVNGYMPDDDGYPYYQTYSFVTKGNPSGSVQKMIDFVSSPKGIALIRAKGMEPLQ